MKRILFASLALSLTLSCFSLPALAAPTDPNVPTETPTQVGSPVSPPASTETETEAAENTSVTLPASDLQGHWAEQSMRTAEQDGFLLGYPDGTLRPDASISKGELISILSRVLRTEPDKLDNPYDKASRREAFLLLDHSFALSAGGKEVSLFAYSDVGTLSKQERLAVSALLSCGALRGYEDATIRPDGSISRAEFVSLLYRVLPMRMEASTISSTPQEAILLSGSAPLKDLTLKQPVYFDGEARDLDFTKVSADRMVILSSHSDTITVRNSKITTLVLRDVGTLSLNVTDGSQINTIVLAGNDTKLSLVGSISHLKILGDNNTVQVASSLSSLLVSGACNDVLGSGSVKEALIYRKDNQMDLPAENLNEESDEGITQASVTLSAPQTLPVESLLTVTATLQNPEPKLCQAVWLVGDRVVKEETVSVTPEGTKVQYLARFAYHEAMNTNFTVRFELRYTTEESKVQVVSSTANTKLENYSPEYYAMYGPGRVLSRVTTGYQGNYTLAWAQANDYDTKTKEIWINEKQYSSQTNYLVWINTTYQRVNVFQGSQGNWKLIKSCIVGTGREGHDTPVGVYTVGTRTKGGWTTEEYNVRPVVRFKMGSGLAFHSRKYDSKHTKMTDASIGFPISLGCVRMYDEDIWWIYDYIPEKTTVVVY